MTHARRDSFDAVSQTEWGIAKAAATATRKGEEATMSRDTNTGAGPLHEVQRRDNAGHRLGQELPDPGRWR